MPKTSSTVWLECAVQVAEYLMLFLLCPKAVKGCHILRHGSMSDYESGDDVANRQIVFIVPSYVEAICHMDMLGRQWFRVILLCFQEERLGHEASGTT